MIWTISTISAFIPAFVAAGEPDQAAIDAYLQVSRRKVHPQKREGVKRWYYLLQEEPRVTLCCVGMPLADWRGGAMCKVGTGEIIGEFSGNAHLLGRKGLRLQIQPIGWLKEPEDQHFASGEQALEAISFQVLDLDKAQRSQRTIAQKYQWK